MRAVIWMMTGALALGYGMWVTTWGLPWPLALLASGSGGFVLGVIAKNALESN